MCAATTPCRTSGSCPACPTSTRIRPEPSGSPNTVEDCSVFGMAGSRRSRTKDGLPNNSPDAILGDGNADLWISSDHNIFRLSLKELNDLADGRVASISPVSFGIPEGMRTSECNSGSPGAWQTADGRIWFPTLRGVVAIDPTAGNPLPPPVVLEEAWAGQLRLEPSGRTSIRPGNNTVDFRFTALSLSAPDKVRFKYRLDPYEKEWVEAGPGRTAHYTNLEPGEYSFQVIAANDYGVWNERGASVRFVLQPHYYQTAWFRALCGMFLLTLVWAAYQLRVRQLRHQFEMTLNCAGRRAHADRERSPRYAATGRPRYTEFLPAREGAADRSRDPLCQRRVSTACAGRRQRH